MRTESFNSEDEAKEYAVAQTSGMLTQEQIHKRLSEYRQYLDAEFSIALKDYWRSQISELEGWLASTEFNDGEYSEGIDTLLFELLEWRASIYAFDEEATEKNIFVEHVFYNQWLIGSAYAIMSIIGKLVSKDIRDNSLRNLWDKVSKYIEYSGECGHGEFELIQKIMHKKTGYFTNESSKAILYRNTVIAHNEKSLELLWSDIDEDIKILCRLWSLITMWSSFGVNEPFRSSEIAFSGLDEIFDLQEIGRLQVARNDYLENAKGWCVKSLVDESVVSGRSPFAMLSVNIVMK